ncbi:30S ribosomal protein S17 [Candidatus Similichlamydia laticola]|uniref:Small ribosomal subunit protein uS17 n=1 Tax=Candidatus Similichlamydia laticola TaxID=2170265 RepID=A0A369KER3_9BACT|nr:30S ribosomal protein S17 [Candidatus Similichlamydia laticola]RDB31387.1 SSU ribosomal protein S17p (S11e) [Candidatus Similichlamydia laticola]
MSDRKRRKELLGVVISNKMQNTVVVEVERQVRHPVLGKVIKRRRKVYADHRETVEIGDRVLLAETRPLSKLKRWRVLQRLV